MPWKETHVEEERMKFIAAHLSGEFPVSELCEAHGVSRKTGYKWIARYASLGMEGLSDQPRARREQATRTNPEIERLIIGYRKKNRLRGPKKIRAKLLELHPDKTIPAASTIGEVLKRHGLVESKGRRRKKSATPSSTLSMVDGPNSVWACDFKGWFRTGDGRRCDPLTISDLHSRFLVRCTAVGQPTFAGVWPEFESAFREYGLPRVIRSDNGAPFASLGLAGLSRLSVRWIRLGVVPERIQPGRPQQNGCHERMHRTLKDDTARPPSRNRSAQQRAFNRFRQDFNFDRPHEAHDQRPPAEFFCRADRPYPSRIPEVEYPASFEVRRVRTAGEIKWRGQLAYVSQTLVGEPVGLEPISDRFWRLCFGPHQIALLDDFSGKILPYRQLGPVPEDS